MAKPKAFFDMQRFKYKCMAEGGKVTLAAPDGHELSILPSAIKNKEFRAMLEAIAKDAGKADKKKLAQGGEVNEFGYPDRMKANIPKEKAPPVKPQEQAQPSGPVRSKNRSEQNERMLQEGKTIQEIQADEKARPMMADGGQVQPPQLSQDQIAQMLNANAANTQAPLQYIDQQQQPQQPGIMDAIRDTGRALMTPAGQAVAPAPQQSIAPQAAPQQGVPQQGIAPQAMAQAPVNQDPSGLKGYNAQMMGGIGMQQDALKQRYNAAVQEGQQKAAADMAYIADLKKTQSDFDQFNAKNQAHIDATVNDIKTNVINPRAYQESMTSADKVTTAIGLMAGGFAQAFVGGNNPAMDFLNKQIDRDIGAQEKNQSNRVTLLNAYQQQFRDKQSAVQMTKATLNSLYAGQLSLAANQAATPQAKANMLEGAGILQMKAAELTKQATLGEYLNNAQTANDGNPERVLAIMQAIDPKRAEEMRGRMVPGIGFATSNDGRKTVGETQVMVSNAKRDLGRLRDILATPLKSVNLNLRAEADTLRRSLVGTLRVPITGPGSMSEGERELLLSLVPNPTDFFSIDSNTMTRLNTLESKMDNGYRNTLEANGLKMPGNFARNPNEGKTAVNAQGMRIIMKNGQWVPVGQ